VYLIGLRCDIKSDWWYKTKDIKSNMKHTHLHPYIKKLHDKDTLRSLRKKSCPKFWGNKHQFSTPVLVKWQILWYFYSPYGRHGKVSAVAAIISNTSSFMKKAMILTQCFTNQCKAKAVSVWRMTRNEFSYIVQSHTTGDGKYHWVKC